MRAGFNVVTMNNYLEGFSTWLQGYQFAKSLNTQEFDAIILQHDNSLSHKNIKATHKKVYTFYGSHQIAKHGALAPLDYVCDPEKTMVLNLQLAMKRWFQIDSLENGLIPPPHLIHRKYPKRIAIHPKSSSSLKDWPLGKYKKVATALQEKGFEPVFIPEFPTLEDLASFIYESGAFLGTDSGPGHLASYLQIPTLTIAQSKKHMRLWKPGWGHSEVITPPPFKFLKKFWKSLISIKLVTKTILNILLIQK